MLDEMLECSKDWFYSDRNIVQMPYVLLAAAGAKHCFVLERQEDWHSRSVLVSTKSATSKFGSTCDGRADVIAPVPLLTWIHIRPTRTKRLIKLTRNTQARWRKHWKTSKSGTQLMTIMPARSAKVLALYKEVSRPLSSTVRGLCTGYLGLNEVLHRIQASEPVCENCANSLSSINVTQPDLALLSEMTFEPLLLSTARCLPHSSETLN
jgi:hypothetical protein